MAQYKLSKQGTSWKVRGEPLRSIFEPLPDGQYLITIQRLHPKRTLGQNARLWGYIYPQVMQAINESEGLQLRSTMDVHLFFGQLIVTGRLTDPRTGKAIDNLPASTKEMSTSQFKYYMDVLEAISDLIYNTKIQYEDE